MNANYLSTQSYLLGDQNIERGIQTDIWGIDHEFSENIQREGDIQVPMFEKEIQCSFGKIETIERETETSRI